MLRRALFLFFCTLGLCYGQSSLPPVYGDCADVYEDTSTNCDAGCGSCFNPNGRSTIDGKVNVVMCPDGTYGYYCNPDGASFACMDWTFGSQTMMRQEDAFNLRT